jgi:hypothetical protein
LASFSSEIFPMRLRPYGMSIATSTQWCFNFVLTKVRIMRHGFKRYLLSAHRLTLMRFAVADHPLLDHRYAQRQDFLLLRFE